MKYKEEISQCSMIYNVDGALIASVANVESNFREDVVSSKGAIGIMQLIPSTAEWVANKIGESYSEDKLYDGDYSLKLGSYYLSYLISCFGDKKTAICAYNAGQGNVKSWLANSKYSSNGKTLDKIPFKETEKYLNKVIKNYSYYKLKYKN